MNAKFNVALLLSLAQLNLAAQPLQVLDAKQYHLRSGDVPEWREFADKTPDGKRLDIRFNARKNAGQSTLFIRQDGVKVEWRVELNGRKLGNLFLIEAPLVHALPIPPDALREGGNTLSILPPSVNDEIMVGDIQLDERPLKDAVAQATLEIQVSDTDSGQELPCRITIVDSQGALAPLYAEPEQRLAARPGVVYAGPVKTRLGVRAGDYTLYATRGFEYGLDKQSVSITAGQTQSVSMRIRREVPTTGLVSSDTHVHTFTYSRHGDATLEERALTLAGEGIELPIATDHEYLADYSAAAAKMGVANYFTSVIGDEITTAKGHFNAFPIVAGSKVPDNRILEWPRLLETIRATPGVRVVVLNHPRNIHSNFQPFAATNFNAVTGENLRGFEFTFDAIEVANSSALQTDWRRSFTDWFALLNYGYRLTAVGSSDCHDVSRYIVGQGRSYVACDDSNPARINVEEACQSFLAGRVLVSLGLLTRMTVDDKYGVGDLATSLGDQIKVTVSVSGPSWTSAGRIELYANGEKVREHEVARPEGSQRRDGKSYDPLKAKVEWRLPRPKHDVNMIALAVGPSVGGLYWAIPRPYQPTSPIWTPAVVGCTNPIWIDGDGDGKFTSARAYAQTLVQRKGTEPGRILPALAGFDSAVAAQTASLLRKAGQPLQDEEFTRRLREASEPTRRGFAAYLQSLTQR